MYTYDDIVTAKDILTGKVKKEDIIGKRGWLLNCIPQDMSLNVLMRVGLYRSLRCVLLDRDCPFYPDGDYGYAWTYFLPEKKESAPEPVIEKKPYKERQAEWVKENNLKVGDKVRILRTAEDMEDGWGTVWSIFMNETIGEIGTVIDISTYNGIRVGSWNYPYFVLEKVEDKPEEAKPVFKVGDRVRIVKEWVDFVDGCEPTVGETGRVEYIDGDGAKVRLDSDNDWWWYDLDAVELIEDEPAYIPFDLSDPKDRDFLRGKWIKDKKWGNEWLIAGFYIDETGGQGWKAKLTRKNAGFTGQELMERFTFLDGSLIGRTADKEEA